MKVDLKSFLRNNGFSHKRDGDRGAVWGNGKSNVFVMKAYDGQGSQLRALMDTVRKSAREKKMEDLQQERKLEEKARRLSENAPEAHRESQIERAKSMPDSDDQEKKAIIPPPEPEPQRPEIPLRSTIDGERLYLTGRLKFLIRQELSDEEIASVLHDELACQQSGKPADPSFVAKTRRRWAEHPMAYARVVEISEAMEAEEIVSGQAEAAEVRPPTKALPVSVGKLPNIVMSILRDEDTSAERKIQMILAWADGD